MPIKRRMGKARKQLDDQELQDLFYGPGTALLNGCGYCGQLTGKDNFDLLTPQEQATVIAEMGDDWQRQRSDVIIAWNDRTDHAIEMAVEHHGDPEEPWAMREFG